MKPEDLKQAKITFLGAGNMAEALVKGLIEGGVCPPENMLVTDIVPEQLDKFAQQYKVDGVRDSRTAVHDADIVVLAVKPQQLVALLAGIQGHIDKRKTLVISIAAGVNTERLEEMLAWDTRVVRVMPNTPALVGAGATAVCAGRWAGEDDLAVAQALFDAVGMVVRVAEKDMDAVTALSGSGPAYVFFLIEAMQEAARQMNLDPGTARKLILATVSGAAALCAQSDAEAGVLRERVTSKGGTTAAALNHLAQNSVFHTWIDAVLAAQQRSRELCGGAS
jgi:pyrroline-5-carboxylate reductase